MVQNEIGQRFYVKHSAAFQNTIEEPATNNFISSRVWTKSSERWSARVTGQASRP